MFKVQKGIILWNGLSTKGLEAAQDCRVYSPGWDVDASTIDGLMTLRLETV
jgi:hypothetical protein